MCLTRVYVGAHLPLDVVGGAGLGLAVAGRGPAGDGASRLMLVDSRRGLLVSGCLLAGAAVVTLLYLLPATRPGVQAVDDAVWRFAGAVENGPATAVSVALAWLGSAMVNWPLRIAALLLLAWRRHWLRALAFASRRRHQRAVHRPAEGRDRPAPPPGRPHRDQRGVVPVRARDRDGGDRRRPGAGARPPGPPRWRWEVYAVEFTAVMALSRVYLRAHWLSDTVAGALLGAGLALGWPALLMALRHRWNPAASTS